MSLIQSKIEGGKTELTEHDLRHVTGGILAGESTDKDHKDDTGPGPFRAATRYPTGSAWLGSKV
jgi:hypothetical protein